MFVKSLFGALISFLGGIGILKLSVNEESYILLASGLAFFLIGLYLVFFRLMAFETAKPAWRD